MNARLSIHYQECKLIFTALSLVHASKFSAARFLRQKHLLVYKDSKCYVENSFASAPEMTMESGDKTEEATANL